MTERIQVKETKTIWPYELEGTIDEMIAKLKELKEDKWELIDGDYFGDSYAYTLIKHRPETYEEYSNRIQSERMDEQRRLEHRRKQYEELRKEFGDD